MPGNHSNPVRIGPFARITEVGWPSPYDYVDWTLGVERSVTTGQGEACSPAVPGGAGTEQRGYTTSFLKDWTAGNGTWRAYREDSSGNGWSSIDAPETIPEKPDIRLSQSWGEHEVPAVDDVPLSGGGFVIAPRSDITWNGTELDIDSPWSNGATFFKYKSGTSFTAALVSSTREGGPACFNFGTGNFFMAAGYGTTLTTHMSKTPSFGGETVIVRGRTFQAIGLYVANIQGGGWNGVSILFERVP